MTYPQDLAFQLRLRNVDEAVVADVVAEVEEYIGTGGDAVTFFGPAAEYATKFPAGPRKRSRAVPIYVGAIGAIAWIAISLAMYASGTWERSSGADRVVLLPALGVLALGLLVSFVIHTVAASRPLSARR
jgi:hypothetical protein